VRDRLRVVTERGAEGIDVPQAESIADARHCGDPGKSVRVVGKAGHELVKVPFRHACRVERAEHRRGRAHLRGKFDAPLDLVQVCLHDREGEREPRVPEVTPDGRVSGEPQAVLAGPVAMTKAAMAKAATGAVGAVPARAAHADGCWPVLAPRGACCYKIVMAIVMAYMLVVML